MGRTVSKMLEEIEWTIEDDCESYKEGWFFIVRSISKPFIQKVDTNGIFKTDEEAYNHVLERKSRVTRKLQPLLFREKFL